MDTEMQNLHIQDVDHIIVDDTDDGNLPNNIVTYGYHSDDSSYWVNIFHNEFMDRLDYDEGPSILPGYPYHNPFTFYVLDMVLTGMMEDHIENEVASDPNSENNLIHTIHNIVNLLYKSSETLHFPYRTSAWHTYFGLAQAWYECDMKVPLEDLIEIYCEYRGKCFDKGEVDYSLGYHEIRQYVSEEDDVDCFWNYFFKRLDTVLLLKMI